MKKYKQFDRSDLARIATIVMKENDLDSSALELSDFWWHPLDYEDFKSLDQLTVFIDMGNGNQRIYIAAADIIALFQKDAIVDNHTNLNSTSIFTHATTYGNN